MFKKKKPPIVFQEIKDEKSFNEMMATQEGMYHTVKALMAMNEECKALREECKTLRESQLSVLTLFAALNDLLVEKEVISARDLKRRFPRFQALVDQLAAAMAHGDDLESDDED